MFRSNMVGSLRAFYHILVAIKTIDHLSHIDHYTGREEFIDKPKSFLCMVSIAKGTDYTNINMILEPRVHIKRRCMMFNLFS